MYFLYRFEFVLNLWAHSSSYILHWRVDEILKSILLVIKMASKCNIQITHIHFWCSVQKQSLCVCVCVCASDNCWLFWMCSFVSGQENCLQMIPVWCFFDLCKNDSLLLCKGKRAFRNMARQEQDSYMFNSHITQRCGSVCQHLQCKISQHKNHKTAMGGVPFSNFSLKVI